jgi:hypothetical protein
MRRAGIGGALRRDVMLGVGSRCRRSGPSDGLYDVRGTRRRRMTVPHVAQGAGEVELTALEGSLRVTVRAARVPRAERR